MNLKETGGQGKPTVTFGEFTVKSGGTERAFQDYGPAKEYYDQLDKPAALWDTFSIPELLHCKQIA